MVMETASWILGVLAIISLAILLVTKIYFLIRRRYGINVHCWFCNAVTRVAYHHRNSWDCKSCEQYNGFLADGGYNKVIYAQHDANFNPVPRCTSALAPSDNGLCDSCNDNQRLKVQQLAAFRPHNEARYDEEVEEYRQELERVYELCRRCDGHLGAKLSSEKAWLLGKKIGQVLIAKTNMSSAYLAQLLCTISTLTAGLMLLASLPSLLPTLQPDTPLFHIVAKLPSLVLTEYQHMMVMTTGTAMQVVAFVLRRRIVGASCVVAWIACALAWVYLSAYVWACWSLVLLPCCVVATFTPLLTPRSPDSNASTSSSATMKSPNVFQDALQSQKQPHLDTSQRRSTPLLVKPQPLNPTLEKSRAESEKPSLFRPLSPLVFNTSFQQPQSLNTTFGKSRDLDATIRDSPNFNSSMGRFSGFSKTVGRSLGFSTNVGRYEDFNSSVRGSEGFNTSMGRSQAFNTSLGRSKGFNASVRGSEVFNTSVGRSSEGLNRSFRGSEGLHSSVGRSQAFNTSLGRSEGFNTSVGGSQGYNTSVGRSEGFNTSVGRSQACNTSARRSQGSNGPAARTRPPINDISHLLESSRNVSLPCNDCDDDYEVSESLPMFHSTPESNSSREEEDIDRGIGNLNIGSLARSASDLVGLRRRRPLVAPARLAPWPLNDASVFLPVSRSSSQSSGFASQCSRTPGGSMCGDDITTSSCQRNNTDDNNPFYKSPRLSSPRSISPPSCIRRPQDYDTKSNTSYHSAFDSSLVSRNTTAFYPGESFNASVVGNQIVLSRSSSPVYSVGFGYSPPVYPVYCPPVIPEPAKRQVVLPALICVGVCVNLVLFVVNSGWNVGGFVRRLAELL